MSVLVIAEHEHGTLKGATLKTEEPPKRKAGVKVPDVKALVEKLKNEAKVIQ